VYIQTLLQRKEIAAMTTDAIAGSTIPATDGFKTDWFAPVRAADITPQRVNWLWPGRVALGKVTLLAGDPGLGKSLLTLDFAARVTRGAIWPGERGEGSECRVQDSTSGAGGQSTREPGSVIVFSAEDDVADTIRPRLEAHGADAHRVMIVPAGAIKGNDGEGRRSFELGRDLELLERMLDRLPDCRLVVIDPISAYLGRAIENTNTEVRSVLDPLAAIAATRNLAVIAVTHLRKKEGATLYRTLGSLAFVAASRAAWLVCRDPADEDRRLFLPLKNNLDGERRGLAFRIESRGERGDPFVNWEEEEVTLTADTALRPPRPLGRPSYEANEACEWLKVFLADGPQPAAELRELAEADGISYATLRRAFRMLDGRATRQENGERGWLWKLPTQQLECPDT
jgi:putative DNA primase/helicase